jgi:Tfp pilus assembly protein PilO
MALDMNVDIGSIIKGLFSKKDSNEGALKTPNPYVKIVLVIVASFICIALYVYFVYIPTQQELKVKNDKISQIESIKYEIAELTTNIEQIKKDYAIAMVEYDRRTTLFHTDKELEDLYGQISLLAMKNKLTITKIEKANEKPIFSEGFCVDNSMDYGEELAGEDQFSDGEMTVQLQKVGYYEFSVDLEISGNYTQFTNFRNGLSQLKKIININKESIVVPGSASKGGEVKVAMSIATYRLPKNEAEVCVDPNSVENDEGYQ